MRLQVFTKKAAVNSKSIISADSDIPLTLTQALCPMKSL